MVKKVVLVNYNSYPTTLSSFLPDNGLAGLAACLKKEGYDTVILDYNTPDIINKLYSKEQSEIESREERYCKEIADYITCIDDLCFVGFKLWTGNGFKGSVKIAENIKKRDKAIRIFGGGPHVSTFKDEIYKYTDVFDALVYDEGEEPIVELGKFSNGKITLENIPNIIFRKENRIITTERKKLSGLECMPFPAYDRETYPSINKKIKIIVSEWARGCVNECNFCIHPKKSGKGYRLKSIERIISELKNCINQGIRTFKSGDSNTPLKHAEKVASAIIENSLDIEYAGIGSVGNISSIDLNLLKKAGWYSIFFGIESGSEYILRKAMNKGTDIKEARDTIKRVKNAGINAVASFIMPSPYESEETKKETLEFILDTMPSSAPINLPMIIPGTEWASNPQKFGIELAKDYVYKSMFFSPTLLLQPIKWNFMDYRINGKDFFKIAEESNNFAKEVESRGITTQAIDDIMIMAEHCNMPVTEFRNEIIKHLSTGNHESIEKIVNRINSS
ncbi:MAG: radical SAM protein [archaeon]